MTVGAIISSVISGIAVLRDKVVRIMSGLGMPAEQPPPADLPANPPSGP